MRLPPPSPEPEDAPLQAPAELISALKRLENERRPFVPPTIDDAILRAARQHLGTLRRAGTTPGPLALGDLLRSILGWKPWLAAAAGAAALVIALAYLLVPTESRRASAERPRTSRDFRAGPAVQATEGQRPGSFQGPGKATEPKHLDIVDALRLAKRLQTGPVSDTRFDINGDGIVDERDAQAIATEAVRLDKPGRS